MGRAYAKRSGAGFFRPLIARAEPDTRLLSFYNLIEAHVLRALRTDHGVPINEVRKALNYAEQELQIARVLLSPELRTHAGQVLLDRYGELINSFSPIVISGASSPTGYALRGLSSKPTPTTLLTTLPGKYERPFIAKGHRSPPSERKKRPDAPGEVTLWLTRGDWEAGSG